MAVEVSIPTILRSYTGGAKTVEASGADALGARSPTSRRTTRGSPTGWSTTPGCAASSTCTSTTRTCASSPAWTPRSSDGDAVTILPAVAGGSR